MEQGNQEGSKSQTITETVDGNDESEVSTPAQAPPVLHLRLERPPSARRVGFHQGVIDNENMNRKKSKCCCIYKKPLAFGESSSEDEEECEHCFGHPELKKKNRKRHEHDHDHNHDHENDDACELHPKSEQTTDNVNTEEKTIETEPVENIASDISESQSESAKPKNESEPVVENIASSISEVQSESVEPKIESASVDSDSTEKTPGTPFETN